MIDVEARMCYGPAYGGVTDVATLTARDVASQFILRDLPTLATLGHLPNLATPTSSAGTQVGLMWLPFCTRCRISIHSARLAYFGNSWTLAYM